MSSRKVRYRKCILPTCLTEGTSGFSKFPTDPDLRKTWCNLLQVDISKINSNHRVCHSHFVEAAFSCAKNRRQLVPNALPSLCLPVSEEKIQIFHSEDLKIGQNFVTSKVNDYEYETLLISNEYLNSSVLPLPVTVQCQIEEPNLHQDHAYFCQKCAPLISDLKEKICMLEKICADQKSELGKMRRKLNLSEHRVSNFRSGNIPKTVQKSICQSALTGEGKKLSGLVIS
jgi:hypothetical protein